MEENNKSSKIGMIIAIAVAVLGIGGAAYMLATQPTSKDKNVAETSSTEDKTSSTNDVSSESSNTSTDTTSSTVITFTDNGFDKAQYTSKAGEAVTVKNDSSMDLQFSSDDHPTHQHHPELNKDVLAPGESTTFTPSGKGTYGFHDHINDEFNGTLVVE